MDLPSLVRQKLGEAGVENTHDLDEHSRSHGSTMDFVFSFFAQDRGRLTNKAVIRTARTNDGPVSEVLVKCEQCGKQDIDREPEWENTDPRLHRAYIVKPRTTCPTATCCPEITGKTGKPRKKAVNYVPVDEVLAANAITQNAATKRAKYNERREQTDGSFCPAFMITSIGPKLSVKVTCSRCASYSRIENHPVWFKKDKRYVARNSSCPICAQDGVAYSVMFLPAKEEKLEYVRYSSLRDVLGILI